MILLRHLFFYYSLPPIPVTLAVGTSPIELLESGWELNAASS